MASREDKDFGAFRRIGLNKWSRITTETPESLTHSGLLIQKTTVSTTASKIVMPEGASRVSIFHQTRAANVYFSGSDDVSTDDIRLDANSTIELIVDNNFSIWMISDVDVTVFAVSTVKEL